MTLGSNVFLLFSQHHVCRAACGAVAGLTRTVPHVVLLHHVFAVEHFVAHFTGKELLSVLLLVLGQVAVGGEKPRADVTLERLVVWI